VKLHGPLGMRYGLPRALLLVDSLKYEVFGTIRDGGGTAMGGDKAWRNLGHQSRRVRITRVLNGHGLCIYVNDSSAYSIAWHSSSTTTLLAACAELAQSKIAVEFKRPALERF